MKAIIKKVLDRHSDGQINLSSEMARDSLATEIAAVVISEMSDTNSVDDWELAKDNPLSIEMWKGYDPNQLELELDGK